MYCSTCGKAVHTGLNYCNHCGTRLDGHSLTVSGSSSRIFAVGSIFIAMGGLFGFFPLLAELLRSGFETPAKIVVLIAYLAAVVLMFSIMVGHALKRTGDLFVERKDNRDASPDAFRPINTAQLIEPAQPMMSVTDHTTRTLEYEPAKRS